MSLYEVTGDQFDPLGTPAEDDPFFGTVSKRGDDWQGKLERSTRMQHHWFDEFPEDEGDEDPAMGEDENLDEEDLLDRIESATAGMHEDDREMVMSSMGDLSTAEIATILGISQRGMLSGALFQNTYKRAIRQLGTKMGRFFTRGAERIQRTFDKRFRGVRRNYNFEKGDATTVYKDGIKVLRGERNASNEAAKEKFKREWTKLSEDLFRQKLLKLANQMVSRIFLLQGKLKLHEDGTQPLSIRKKSDLEARISRYQRIYAMMRGNHAEIPPLFLPRDSADAALPPPEFRINPAKPGTIVVEQSGVLFKDFLANPSIGKKYAQRVFKWDDEDIANEQADCVEFLKTRLGVDFSKGEPLAEGVGSIININGTAAAKMELYALNTPALNESDAVRSITGFGGDASKGSKMREVGFKVSFLHQIKARGELDGTIIPKGSNMFYGKWLIADDIEGHHDPSAVIIHFETPDPAIVTSESPESPKGLHLKYDVLYQDLAGGGQVEYAGTAQRVVSYEPLCDPSHMHAGKSVACMTKCLTKIKFAEVSK